LEKETLGAFALGGGTDVVNASANSRADAARNEAHIEPRIFVPALDPNIDLALE
jgi:hypothetical protein